MSRWIRASWPRRTRGRGPRPWPPAAVAAEERVHDVGEGEPGARTGAAEAAEAALAAAHVVLAALLRVRQDLVGAADVLEPLLRRRVGVHVGVQLARELAVGLLDGRLVRVAGDTEDLVGVVTHSELSDTS